MPIARTCLITCGAALMAAAWGCGGRSDLSSANGTNNEAPSAVGSGGSGHGQGGAGDGGNGDGGQGGVADTCTPTPVPLAEGQLGPQRVFLNDGNLYWTDHNTGRGQVMRVSVDGGAPEVVASDLTRPRGIAVDSNHVYWTDALAGAVERSPKNNDMVESVAPWQHIPTAIAVGNNGVYWANYGQNADGRIMFWSENSGGPVPIAGGADPAIHVAVDDSRVWWLSDGATASNPGALRSKPIDGDISSYIAPVETPRTLAIDDERVYVGDAGTIRATFKDSGPLATFVSDAVTRGMASDGQHLYWSDAQGRVNRIPVAGGEITRLAEFQAVRGIAVGERCVYVAVSSSGQNTNDGSVWKLRK